MSGPVLTAAMLRETVAKLRDNRPADRCPPHLVHPRYVAPGWELVGDYRDGDAVVGCANLCGTTLVFRYREDPA